MKNRHTWLLVASTLPACAPGSGGALAALTLNEVMVHNTSTLQDASGAWPDWIEIRNDSGRDVPIALSWITDDHADPLKHMFPEDAPAVPARGYLVVFADEDVEQGPLHLSFALDAQGGEDVALFGPVDDDLPEIDALIEVPAAEPDVSYARNPEGSDEWSLTATPTPGAANTP